MYRVCIPTAGLGSRLNEVTRNLNKALVSVSNRPAITHIVELLPVDVEIVVPLGHKGELVREYLEFAHPDRSFIFATIVPYSGSGSGLGTTLLQVQHHLREPFVFSACDSITNDRLPEPNHNWVGYGEHSDTNSYRTIGIKDGLVEDIFEKSHQSSGGTYPYCGIAGVRDVQYFWDAMNDGGEKVIEQGESYGLKALVNLGLIPHKIEWFDTGTKADLARTRALLAKKGPEPNVLEKADEAIWFIGDRVIKYSNDTEFIRRRVARAMQLNGFVPQMESSSTHMFSYKMVEGQVLSSVVDTDIFVQLLDYAKKFWSQDNTETADSGRFQEICREFYQEKTIERVTLFFKNSQLIDNGQTINGMKYFPIGELLDLVDWSWLADGNPVRFHGDFHFENIIYDMKTCKFTLIDWRQDFGGSLTAGDQYYDLAKLLHGLIVSHKAVVHDKYHIKWDTDRIEFSLDREKVLKDCESLLLIWMGMNGIDSKKVYTLTSLIFLNIAPLHHFPYSHFLYALGKSMLQKELAL
jgi:hypothetical protein